MLYSHLGPKITEEELKQFQKEGIVFDSQSIWLTFICSKLNGPFLFVYKKRKISKGRLIITKQRIVCLVGFKKIKILNIKFSSPFYRYIVFEKERDNRFIIKVKLDDFKNKFKGQIILKFHIDPESVPLT